MTCDPGCVLGAAGCGHRDLDPGRGRGALMAVVTVRFEDTVSGPFDGSAHVSFESEPPFLVLEDGTPVVESLTLAQKQALVAMHAVDSNFRVLDAKFTQMPFEEEEHDAG